MTGKRRAAGPAVKTAPPTPSRWRRRLRRVLKWLSLLGLLGLLLLAGAAVLVYRSIDIPDPNRDFETQTSFVYYAGGEDELGTYAEQNRESIPLDEMPQSIKDAVVAAENRSFWTDKGIDPKGILRAAFSNASGGSTQGASTITQQYVKILYLTQERSYQRKVKEAVLSLKIQRQLSKSEILEGYLNTIYFGRGAYGVQAAAKAYFDKPAAQLSLRESAVLARILNNPSRYDPANGKAARTELKAGYRLILEGMVETGTIEADEAAKAEKRLPRFPDIPAESTNGGQRGHMMTLVRDELRQLGYSDDVIDGGGLRVTTTFTRKAMAASADGVREARPEGFSDKQLHIASASVEPGTGALRGFYGGQDYLRSQINWAEAGGMVGSTFKPISLATALEAGFSLEDTFEGDSPYEFPDGLTVRNEGSGPDGLGNDYGARVDATYALEQSINTAFVDMSASIPDGPARILATANRLGIPPVERAQRFPGIPRTSRDLEADALITLGKARISPINMANAYASIANGGERARVHVIDSIVDRTGEEVYRFKDATTRAVSEEVAADTSYAMQRVVADGTGAAAQALGRPAAGKTGTATNDDDDVSSAWFVGYTPQLSTAVMYVRGDGDDALDGWLPSYFGADYPTDTWLAVMQRALDGVEEEDFPPPANLDDDAPDDEHEPTPSVAPQPTREPTREPTRTPSSEPTPTTSETPTAPVSPSAPPTSAPPSEVPTTSAPPTVPPTTATPPAPSTPPAATAGPTDPAPLVPRVSAAALAAQAPWAPWAPLARWTGWGVS